MTSSLFLSPSRTFVLTVWIYLAAPTAASAQSDPSWSLDIGGAVRVRPDHVGAGQYTVDAAPIVEGHFGDRLTVSFDDGLRWAVFKSGPFSAGPVLEYRQSYNDARPGARRRFDGDLELGGFVGVNTPLGEGEVRLRQALSGYRGWSGDLAWDVGGELPAGFKLGAEARLSWTNAAYLDRQFGLPAMGRRSLSFGRGDSYTAGLEVALAHPIGKRLTAALTISDDHLLGAAPNSSLFKSRDEVIAGFGVVYRLGSTKRR
jgi:outer membrane scaffolding protein for murein synthesis (MipA/OmpV family)